MLRPSVFVAIALCWLSASASAQDAHTILRLPFDGSMMGAANESPTMATGYSFTAGVKGQAAYFTTYNVVRYLAAGNISATEGTLWFWLKPNWNPGTGQSRIVLAWGGGGGALFGKDGGDFLRCIFNRFAANGAPESGTGIYVDTWRLGAWHHVAYTWSDSAKRVRLYIDGALASEEATRSALPAIPDTSFSLGSDNSHDALGGTLDELEISDVERTAAEVQANYMAAFTISSISVSPATLSLTAGTSKSVTVTAQTSIGSRTLPPSELAWTSTDPSVAVVDAAGRIYARSGGHATITFTAGAARDTVEVTVAEPARRPTLRVPTGYLATPAAGYLYEMPVVSIRYIPTKDGINIDAAPTGWSGKISDMESRLDKQDAELKFALEEGSRFRGYKNAGALPSLGYRVVRIITVYEELPPDENPAHSPGGGVYFADYTQILDRWGIRSLVRDLGVKEVWLWGYHHGIIVPAESDMASPTTGDISNSYRFPDNLPILDSTYVLYNYNWTRNSDMAIHNHGHQLESIYDYVSWKQDGNTNLFRRSFTGVTAGGTMGTGRAGNCHCPPNTAVDYDYYNTTLVYSDIEDWTPAGTGVKKRVNANTWGGITYAWPHTFTGDKIGTQWYIYWYQAMPGRDNGIAHSSNRLTNWWLYTGEWDAAVTAAGSSQGLYAAGNVIAPMITSQPVAVLIKPGAAVHLNVLATPTGALRYQWRHGGKPLVNDTRISGATTASLTIANATSADAGRYDAYIWDGAGLAVTRSVWLPVALTWPQLTHLARVVGGIEMAGEDDLRLLDQTGDAALTIRDLVMATQRAKP